MARKIIAIANPPYHEMDGGHRVSARPIYHLFIEKLMDFKIEEFLFLIPGKWFVKGKGLTKFRQRIKDCGKIKAIRHFPKANQIFPCIEMHGGLCFLHYQNMYLGLCLFQNNHIQEFIDLKEFDVILREVKSHSILRKIKAFNYKTIADVMSARNTFGLNSDHFKKNSSISATDNRAVPCLAQARKIQYANYQDIKRNHALINLFKIAIPTNYGRADRDITLQKHQIFIIPPGKICTETYLIVSSFVTQQEAERFQSYLQTNFARYLLGIRKIAQHLTREFWQFVPLIPTDILWTDKMLFEHFNLNEAEQEHILNHVKELS